MPRKYTNSLIGFMISSSIKLHSGKLSSFFNTITFVFLAINFNLFYFFLKFLVHTVHHLLQINHLWCNIELIIGVQKILHISLKIIMQLSINKLNKQDEVIHPCPTRYINLHVISFLQKLIRTPIFESQHNDFKALIKNKFLPKT